MQENSERNSNLIGLQAEKAKNCTGGIQPSTAKNHSRNNQGKDKPSTFIAGDRMAHDLKDLLVSRDNVVKVHSFRGASCDDMGNFLISLMNRRPNQILLHVSTND